MYLNVYLFQNKSTGLHEVDFQTGWRGGGRGVLLPKNDFQTGGLMEGRGEGGLLEEKWGLTLRDFTLKQHS